MIRRSQLSFPTANETFSVASEVTRRAEEFDSQSASTIMRAIGSELSTWEDTTESSAEVLEQAFHAMSKRVKVELSSATAQDVGSALGLLSSDLNSRPFVHFPSRK